MKLKDLIQSWTPPQAPGTSLDEKMLGRFRKRHKRSWWRRFVEARISISVPVPVAVALALSLIAVAVFLRVRAHDPYEDRFGGFTPVARPHLIVERIP